MRIKKMIAEGTMAPKVTYEDDFVNPITGETLTCEMTFAVTRDKLDMFAGATDEKSFKDVMEKLAREEYDNSNARYQYDVIKNYATEHNFVEITDTSGESIWNQVKDVIETAECPKIVLDFHLASEMKTTISELSGEEGTVKNTSGPFYMLKIVSLYDKTVRIFVHSYAAWSQRNCLVYDENNLKNCKLITYAV